MLAWPPSAPPRAPAPPVCLPPSSISSSPVTLRAPSISETTASASFYAQQAQPRSAQL